VWPAGQGKFVSPPDGFCGSTLYGQNANIPNGFGEGRPGGTIGRRRLIAFRDGGGPFGPFGG
jgi:hypothetical protein